MFHRWVFGFFKILITSLNKIVTSTEVERSKNADLERPEAGCYTRARAQPEQHRVTICKAFVFSSPPPPPDRNDSQQLFYLVASELDWLLPVVTGYQLSEKLLLSICFSGLGSPIQEH